jgi:hypothetical protein
MKITLAAAAQWRETTDAVYTQPNVSVANTGGRPGSYAGSYGQACIDWTADRGQETKGQILLVLSSETVLPLKHGKTYQTGYYFGVLAAGDRQNRSGEGILRAPCQ